MMTAVILGNLVASKILRNVTIYLKPEIYEAVKRIALEEDRTMSKLLGRVVTEWVSERGKILDNVSLEVKSTQ